MLTHSATDCFTVRSGMREHFDDLAVDLTLSERHLNASPFNHRPNPGRRRRQSTALHLAVNCA